MRVLRLPEVEKKVGLRHSAIYKWMKLGRFPKPVSMGVAAKGWIEAEIDAFIEARIAERDGCKAKEAHDANS